MLVRNQWLVFVVAVLVTHSVARSNDAQESYFKTVSSSKSTAMDGAGFNGFDQFRMIPDFGMAGSAGHGYKHFTMPMNNYTTWYRPRAATLNQCVRCAPDSFRPRGFGHLFARPCDGYRMEYSPYVMSGANSMYGPSYIARQPDPRCEHCDPQSDKHHH